ncbi:hypothetical protein IV203_026002 [Nitzschia inconspicua]|uniref:Uncharacterized protein n=1 Tax=Nitzschia inconspicua TaxID=303405 RepID=A0A9K3LHS8_9STRA|nr:hypothetical protein IV203_026002 [Nitzschia inconspicua]
MNHLALLQAPQHIKPSKAHKLPYCTILGELLYAHVTACPDIGYHVITLSQLPLSHYLYLTCIAKYLRWTINWNPYFQKPHANVTLPSVPLPSLNVEPATPDFPHIDPDQLTAFVDAAYANNKRNQSSATGSAFTIACATIAYHS